MKRTIASTAIACLVAGLAFAAVDASAATLKIKCEQRGTQRATISVDGSKLPSGLMYTAEVSSGLHTATSAPATPVGGELEFDFDSDAGDIAEGATPIAGDFIVNGSAIGMISSADGTSFLIANTVPCRVRSH